MGVVGFGRIRTRERKFRSKFAITCENPTKFSCTYMDLNDDKIENPKWSLL